MKSFFSNLNTRQLIIHFIAIWFFIYGTHVLISLFDYHFLYTSLMPQNELAYNKKLDFDKFIIYIAGYVGLIVAYVISWSISAKYHWFWANTVIAFLTAFILYYFNLLAWEQLKIIFLKPGNIYATVNSVTSIIINGVLLLAIGSLLFFNRKIIRFIDRGVKREDKTVKIKAN